MSLIWRRQPRLYIATGRVALVSGKTPAEVMDVEPGAEIAAARVLVERIGHSSIDVLWGAAIVSIHWIGRIDGVLGNGERIKAVRAVLAQDHSPQSAEESLIDVVAPAVDSDWLAYRLPRHHVDALNAALPATRVRRSGVLCAEAFTGFEFARAVPHLVAVLEGSTLSWVSKTARHVLAAGQTHVGRQTDAAHAELRRQGLRLGVSEDATLLCADAFSKRNEVPLPASWRTTASARTLRVLAPEDLP